MHKLAEKIADCMKAKVEAKGIDNIEGQDLVELGMWTDIIKDLVCYDKDKKIIEAMDEAEDSEEAMRYIEMYEDYPRKGYRGQPRSKTSGRFMRRGDGRRSYMPMMYEHDYDWDGMQSDRDIDRHLGRMGYTEPMHKDETHSESRYDRARRGYEETKAMHKSGSVEDKKKNMESLEHYMKELSEEMAELIESMDANEKTMVRSKLQTLAQKIS